MRRHLIVGTLILLVLLGLVAGGSVLVAAVTRFGNTFSGTFGEPQRRHPVPVPKQACPALALVRSTSATAAESWLDQLDSSPPSEWQAFAATLGPELERLAAALRSAIAATPPVVSASLTTVLHEVEIGQLALPTSTDLDQYLAATNYAVVNGVEALADASDLVGRACGAPIYEGSPQLTAG